jgi:hypothetical protein
MRHFHHSSHNAVRNTIAQYLRRCGWRTPKRLDEIAHFHLRRTADSSNLNIALDYIN